MAQPLLGSTSLWGSVTMLGKRAREQVGFAMGWRWGDLRDLRGLWEMGAEGFPGKAKAQSCEELRVVSLRPNLEPAVTLSKGQHTPNFSVLRSNRGQPCAA